MAKWNFIAILFLALVNSLSAAKPVKNDTNKMVWGCSATPFRELCLSLLRSDPRSYDAKGYREVGQIMVEFALAKAEETLSFVKSSENKTTDKAVGASLVVCRGLYDRIIRDHIPNALETSKQSEENATRIMGEASSDGESCEKEFSKNHVKSVLTKRNQEFSDIANIARYIWYLDWS
ncbi:cell wall / vacuolar inhibitor of fructosidase 1-like [Ipomoea triloba]|uniref:cell wall / vacuolar inhibitor of fructosidase 1-like n=1 Tax=Ipomoea triloba TaxID=35885 RepID=UPI00125E1591|nr:cell wall / vacuolar inhibitor of fructosidase 1-like [Ipomoea triloba]